VKEPLKLPFLFLFILLCALVVLSALNVLFTWGMQESGTRAFSLGWAAARLPRSAFEALLPAVVLSLVGAGIRMVRRPFSRFLGLLLCLVVSYACLVNGMIWLRLLARRALPAQATAADYFSPGSFTRVGGSLVVAQSADGQALAGVLVATPSAAAGSARLAVHPRAEATLADGAVRLRLPGRAAALAGRPDLQRAAVFAPDTFTRYFLRDIDVLVADFEGMLAGSLPEFFAASFALLFLCTASFVFLRLSRWPMLNVLLLLLAVRACALLWHFLSVSAAPRIASHVSDALLARMFPSAVMAALAVVLLLADILFVPADRWKRMEAA
jgi:hypothetical protein